MEGTRRELIRRLFARLRDAAPGAMLRPVVQLTGADGLNAALGILIWIVAARRLDLADIGGAAAAISLAALLGNVSTLGMGLALTRYRHLDDAAYPGLLGGSLLVATGLAALLASAFILVVTALGLDRTAALFLDPVWVVVLVVSSSWCGILDAVAVAEGDAGAVLIRTGVTSAMRVLFLATLVTNGREMFASTAAAISLSVLPAMWRRRAILSRALAVRPRVYGAFLSYSLRHYFITWVFNAPTYLLPIITVSVLGPRVAGSVVLGWSAASLLSSFGDAAALALVAQGSRKPSDVGIAHRRIIVFVGPVLVLTVVAALLGAGLLPFAFGPHFDAPAILSFQLFALAAIPYLAVTMAVGRLRVVERPQLILLIAIVSGILPCVGIAWLEPWAGSVSPAWAYLAANCVAAVPALSLLFGLSRPDGPVSADRPLIASRPNTAPTREPRTK